MHPAISIIFFTTFSGLGFGLVLFLGLDLVDTSRAAGRVAYALGLAMIGGGLLSSTFHLGHPERAWRALSQWKTSWLSREGVLAVIALIPLGLAGLGIVIFGEYWRLPALLGALLALPVVYATAMIYASLKTVYHWASALTPLCYLAFALGGGALGAYCVAASGGDSVGGLPLLALILIESAWIFKSFWWRRADLGQSASTPESATGLGAFGKVSLLERPHVTENYLTREMGHKVARKHAKLLRRLAFFFGAFLPLIAILVVQFFGGPGNLWLAADSQAACFVLFLSFLSYCLGLIVERWLFFAEAKHTVMLYYGRDQA